MESHSPCQRTRAERNQPDVQTKRTSRLLPINGLPPGSELLGQAVDCSWVALPDKRSTRPCPSKMARCLYWNWTPLNELTFLVSFGEIGISSNGFVERKRTLENLPSREKPRNNFRNAGLLQSALDESNRMGNAGVRESDS
jgi:hypothetical protein